MINWLKKHLRNLESISLMVVMVFSVFVQPASAVRIPTTQITMSRHTVNLPADHAYKFQTPSGIDSPTDTITIDITDWNATGVTFADIDLFHGATTGLENTDTIAALPGINTWGAIFSGDVLTLAPPLNAVPGTIPLNDFITVRIGQNAVGGTNQILNPSTVGSHTIVIAGGFGDMTYAAQATNGGDTLTVSGEVLPALQITNLNPSSVPQGTCGITITITGVGFVSSSQAQLDGAARPTIYVSSTEVIMTPLCSDMIGPGIKQITVYNPIPTLTSNQLPFSITSSGGGGCTEIPSISNVQATNLTANSAHITWDTDVVATSLVDYGLTTTYTNTVSNGALVFSHGLDLTGLAPSTTYHYRVTSNSICGNADTSADFSFTTPPFQPLAINNVSCSNITDTSLNVVWDTNRPADSRVEFGKTPGLGNDAYLGGFVSNHLVPLTSLDINTFYHYRVISYDINGNGATSTIFSCQTLPDITPPTNVFFTATPDCDSNNLTWTHSPEPDFAGIRVVSKLGSYPTGPFDGNLVYDGLATFTNDTGLTNSVTYYYAAYAYDTNGNFASGSLSSASPVCPLIPPTTTTPPIPPTTTTPPVPPTTTTPPILPTTTTPPIPPTPTTTPVVITIDPIYYGADGTLLLEPDPDGVHGVLPNEPILVVVPVGNLGETAQTATITVNGQTYSLTLSPDGTTFTGTFPAPPNGIFPTDVQVTFVSGALAEALDNFEVQIPGDVVEAKLIPGITPVPGATVTLYQIINGTPVIWNGAPYGHANPILSDENGLFLFRVPNGDYYVEVGKVGFELQTSQTLRVERNVFGDHIELIYIPEPLIITTCQIDCTKIDFDLYIVNPDGTERHINTEYVEADDLGNQITLYRFEDKGLDFDYNDVLIQVDRSDCEHLKFIVLKTDAKWHHIVRAKILYEGTFRKEFTLTTDSHQAYGRTLSLDLTNDPTLCEEEVERILQIEVIPEQIEFTILTSIDFLRGPDLLSLTNEWLVPSLIVVSLLNLGTALSLFNLLAYLQYLFTQPILLFGRLRKRRWGIVYNSLNKQPIEMAIVRLLHQETKLIVQTKVTDKDGRYFFRVKKGSYIIEVIKPQYDFPTQYLANKREDAVFPNIYHGEPISLEEDGIIALNIPLDPQVPVETPRKVLYRRFFKRLQHAIAILSILFALVAFVISPTWFIGVVLLAQIGFYFLFRQLALPAKAQSWGRVFDAKTKKPIRNSIVRIFDKQFNKLLETQLSSRQGKYGFFAEHNIYYITVEKDGFQKFTSKDLDLGSQEDTTIDLNIPLKRISPPKK
jgi:Purple acid Phosphatase, N-terminal domain